MEGGCVVFVFYFLISFCFWTLRVEAGKRCGTKKMFVHRNETVFLKVKRLHMGNPDTHTDIYIYMEV